MLKCDTELLLCTPAEARCSVDVCECVNSLQVLGITDQSQTVWQGNG